MSKYTAITFAPVQGFIEKSRKLRDLYGSSYILSHLADRLCQEATTKWGLRVISPALINVTKGTPNTIMIRGNFQKTDAQDVFKKTWGNIVDECRLWIEDQLKEWDYCWREDWRQWHNYAWEFFWAQGETANEARQNLVELKRSRAWVGINWKGESSTLSGADAIAYPTMPKFNPKSGSYQKEDETIKQFYQALDQKIGEMYQLSNGSRGIIEPTEQLSIPELIKRLVTIEQVANKIGIQFPDQVHPTYKDLNRLEQNEKTGWFMGDGDSFGNYLQSLTKKEEFPTKEESNDYADHKSQEFSLAMRNWARDSFTDWVEENGEGRVIYAGGDDFLGVFYQIPKTKITTTNEEPQFEKLALTATQCLERFYKFPTVWKEHKEEVTVSVGFVWAYPGVPQRDVLQHCRRAEKAAKDDGKDRIAIRILFNSGNHLEWSCPWDYLKKIFTGYCDRSGGQNWTHLYNDIAVLKSRHAFDNQGAIAQALWEIYFPEIAKDWNLGNDKFLWNIDDDNKQRQSSGILGKQETLSQSFTDWFINLAKVGFHLYV